MHSELDIQSETSLVVKQVCGKSITNRTRHKCILLGLINDLYSNNKG